jgi:hypothetical protein
MLVREKENVMRCLVLSDGLQEIGCVLKIADLP